jgi:type I restriction enzyme S subunit
MATDPLFGPLPEHWEVVTLGEACSRGGGDVQTGPFGSQLHASDYVPAGIPSIMPQNIGDNRVLTDGIARITADDAQRLSRYRVRKGDIVYSRRGDVERRALIRDTEDGWLCGTGCLRVRFGDGMVDPVYASYYLGHPSVREWIVRHAIGATMPNLNTSILSALPFVIPPLPRQHEIGRILSTLDDKIELNRRMNETLEAIAQALFNSWFVDFDPVRSKMEGQQPFGMDDDIATLFPSSFEETRQGLIPQGWQISKLGQVVTINERSVTKDYPHQTIRYIDISSVTKGRLRETTQYELTEAPSRARRLVQQGDTIWSTVRPNRKSYLYIQNPMDNYVVSTGFAVLTPRLISPSYLYNWVTTQQFVDYLSFSADGSAYPAVSPQRFSEAEILLPPTAILEKFEEQAGGLYKMVAQNEAQAVNLAELRDALLPKLLSGELRVQDVERRVEN